jgi:DNA-binding SARP family transcriptional activator
VARPRLIRALAGQWKVVTLVAPAGWGKSTLAAQLTARRSTLWVTLGPEHRTPARLLGAVLAGAARLSPPLGRSMVAMFDARRDFERDGGLLTARLVHEFASPARPLMIVLDDAHELAGARAALAWAAALIEATPASVRFVIAARGESPFAPGRFTGLRERTLDREALAFNRTEARRLMEQMRVPRPRRAALAARHGGWVTGLVAGARASDAPASEWATLAARELEGLDGSVRRDLLIASGLDELDPGALAAALTTARSRRLLDAVRRRGLYVESGRGGLPRFHPLFQDVLRDLAARELPARERQRALGRAAEHWRRQGLHVRAILALAAAGLPDQALTAFERAWREGDASARDALGPIAERWLEQGEPGEAAGLPAVLLAASRQDVDGGRFDKAGARARAAAHGWLDTGQPLAAAQAYSQLSSVANHTVQFAPAIRDGLELLRRLASGRGPSHSRRAAIALVRARVGTLRLYAGDPEGARADLDAALRGFAGRPNTPEYADTEVSRATLEFTAGRWEPYLMRARRALAVYRRTGYWGRAYALLVNMAEGYTYLGDEAGARAHLDEAADLADRSGSFARRALLEISRARTFSEEGAMRPARRAFQVARREIARASIPLYEAMLDTWEGVFERRCGRLANAERRLASAEARFARLESPSWQNVARLERALVAGLAGRTADALGVLRECARVSRRLGDRKEEARVWLFAARVAQQGGRPHAAYLRTAVRLLDRENYPVLLRKERDVAEPLGIGPGRPGSAARVPPSRREVAPTARATPIHVHVRMFGGFALERAGVDRPIERTAARQLVALLALRRGRPDRREALAERLWPEAPAAASRNRFDVALSAARHAMEPDAGPRGPFTILRGERGMLWLDDGVECDVDRFETLATQADREGTLAGWQRAAAAYTGPLLPEWGGAEWTEDARERLRTRYARVLVAAARAARSRRDLTGAIDWAERALVEDPLDETAVGVMMNALVEAGRRSEAKRRFQRFVVQCEEQIGARPGPELMALAGELGIGEDS